MSFTLKIILALAAVAFLGILSTFQVPPVQGVQHGFRGTGMVEIYDPKLVAATAPNNIIPASLPRIVAGPKASTVYKNVQVLGDLSVGEFTRLMASITTWVAPKQGCNYCHNPNNMAEDSHYTKIVARRMIQMTRHVNADWQTHVVATGVTCWTCHRGNNIPVNYWFNNPGPEHFAHGNMETDTGKNLASAAAGGSSLPYDPFTPYLEQANNIRVIGNDVLPVSNNSSIKQTDWTYALMMHMSTSLGVNCTYCHNTRAMADWSQSPPQRVTAWYGIRMVRSLNNDYMDPLKGVFPAYRLGVSGDVAKVNCATCHQGVYKPLYGVSMLKDFPELAGPSQVPAKGVEIKKVDAPPAAAPAADPNKHAEAASAPILSEVAAR